MSHPGFFTRKIQEFMFGEPTRDITRLKCWNCKFLVQNPLPWIPKTYKCYESHFDALRPNVPESTAKSLGNCKDFQQKEKQK